MKDRVIHKVVVVPAMIDEVWEAWTTSAGARTFFGSDAKIELAIGGRFEIYFDKNEPPGRRGSEGCKVLSYLPKEMLSFSWNSPPEIPAMRNVYIWVVVQFEQMETHSTRVTLTHLGWQEGPEWDKSYAYFNRAWGTVLFWLDHRFRHGPIDWSNPPRPVQK